MNLSVFFKSIVDSDIAPIVVCNIKHEIIYMNPTAIKRYAKRGGAELIGKSLLDCHNAESNDKIKAVVSWFSKSPENNRIFTFHNPKENKDVYMIALRDGDNSLIGYYEKHEIRDTEKALPYSDICHKESD
ncbi:MAG: PAS domain-containing protein [Ruminococcus sp.]|nr:PAS domain-containing protein [Ruminococcus sp.]MDE7098486.1 PAS domain-containing protein [Ruminococcus sp.]